MTPQVYRSLLVVRNSICDNTTGTAGGVFIFFQAPNHQLDSFASTKVVLVIRVHERGAQTQEQVLHALPLLAALGVSLAVLGHDLQQGVESVLHLLRCTTVRDIQAIGSGIQSDRWTPRTQQCNSISDTYTHTYWHDMNVPQRH
jgi:hypothetical protein